MNKLKTALMVGAGVSAVGLASLSTANLVSADTVSTSDSNTTIVDKIATKFGLNKSEVQAVFDENREAHMTEMKANRAEALKQAVTDGKLTQDQADHITAVWKEIDDLRGTTTPGDESDETRDQIKDKMDALKDWLDDQNIDLSDIDGLRGPGFGGHGHRGFGGPRAIE